VVTLVGSEQNARGQTWKLELGETPGTVILSGEIDFSVTPKVREKLLEVIESGVPEIVLDLSGLSYVDSSGLALFIEARRMLAASGRTIRIEGITPQVEKLFHLTQIGDLFGLTD
jgi:anti-sigma B factor antagonist